MSMLFQPWPTHTFLTSGKKAGSRFARALNLPLRLEKRYDGLGINKYFEQRRKIWLRSLSYTAKR